MSASEPIGRPNQKARTRKDLLQAASRLIKQGRTPTLEEVVLGHLAAGRSRARDGEPRMDAEVAS